MRLVNMEVDRFGEIDRFGANERFRVGPLAPGLNAICGHKGSGKSTLLSWLRSVAEENRSSRYSPPDPAWNSGHCTLAGIAEFENRGRRFRVTTDRNGRIRFDELSGPWDRSLEKPSGSNLTGLQREAFVGLAAANGILDTEAALEKLALRLGVTDYENVTDDWRVRLNTRHQEIEHRLLQLENPNVTQESLLARQKQLEAELRSAHSSGQVLRYEGQGVEYRRLEERYSAIELDLQQTLQQLERFDRDLANKHTELKLLETDTTAVTIGESYRVQLQQLDDRLNRWRQTLRDLRSHRETMEHNATDARLDKQIGDQLSPTKEPDPRAAMRSLESQIMQTRHQLDDLVERYTTIPGYDYRSASAAVAGTGFRTNEVPHSHGVYRDTSGRTYVGHPTYLPESSMLPETLRSMQKDLHEVCQQLSRYEAKAATETFRQQTLQLKRCETELLQAVEKLIDERAGLLRRIASEHHLSIEQLTLAFGQWCQCHDHPHLHDWLLSEESNCSTTSPGPDSAARQSVLDEIHSLRRARTEAAVRADECRRQIRDADLHRRGIVARKAEPIGRPESEIRRDLQQVANDLADLSNRDSLRSELRDIQIQLREPRGFSHHNAFYEMTHRHAAGLMGDPLHAPYQRSAAIRGGSGNDRRYDLVDGALHRAQVSPSDHFAGQHVPPEVLRIAMRLAIAENLAKRGEPVALILDDSVDGLTVDLQKSVIGYLAATSNGQQQIVILTADQRVAEMVQAQQGCVRYLRSAKHSVDSGNINRQLSALANDHEADKWYQPVVSTFDSRGSRNEFYLHERSLIEDLPSIDPDLANRCRALGVDRIGDLLDIDPAWLANHLCVSVVTRRTVEIWQSMASLLCGVRKLRPFDARVLVGAGVQSPEELAEMHPSHLLDRVERFMTTEHGRRILRSGNSYELSRITSWIASAKGGSARRHSDDMSHFVEYREDRRRMRESQRNRGFDESRSHDRGDDYGVYSVSPGPYARSSTSQADPSQSRRPEWASGVERTDRKSYPIISRTGDRTRQGWDRQDSDASDNPPEDYEQSSLKSTKNVSRQPAVNPKETEAQWKFYLELTSPVVDAPSIGPRMATRLEECKIYTVDQLLAADPESLADKLNQRRVDADTIRSWQDQTRLVCRIPNLRGHDAQLLVACDITSPETLAKMDGETVLTQVTEIAESKDGQRILRGSKAPDLNEVTDWIAWATHCRQLSAA